MHQKGAVFGRHFAVARSILILTNAFSNFVQGFKASTLLDQLVTLFKNIARRQMPATRAVRILSWGLNRGLVYDTTKLGFRHSCPAAPYCHSMPQRLRYHPSTFSPGL